MPVTRSPSRPVSGSPVYAPNDLPVYRGGGSDPLTILGSKLAAWYTSHPSTLFTTSTGETPVTAAGEPVGLRVNKVAGGPNASQATAAARPLWQTGPNRLVYDAADDALNITLPAISGGQIVISSPVGIWIESLDFAGGTFLLGPKTHTGGVSALWPILDNAEMQVCVIDTAMTTEEQSDLVDYLVANGSPGLITLGASTVINGGDPFVTTDNITPSAGVTASVSAGALVLDGVGSTTLGGTVALSTPAKDTAVYLIEYTAETLVDTPATFDAIRVISPGGSANSGEYNINVGSGILTRRVIDERSADGTTSTLHLILNGDATSQFKVYSMSYREIIFP